MEKHRQREEKKKVGRKVKKPAPETLLPNAQRDLWAIEITDELPAEIFGDEVPCSTEYVNLNRVNLGLYKTCLQHNTIFMYINATALHDLFVFAVTFSSFCFLQSLYIINIVTNTCI